MANLKVDDANFKSERAVVEEEYRQSVLASPYGRLFNALSSASYLEHPYKRPTIGSIADLEASTLADVVAFHARYYRPDNATLVVAGDFDPAQLDAWIDKYFGAVARPATPLPVFDATEPAWKSDRSVTVTGPQVPLPAVAYTWLAPPVTMPTARRSRSPPRCSPPANRRDSTRRSSIASRSRRRRASTPTCAPARAF